MKKILTLLGIMSPLVCFSYDSIVQKASCYSGSRVIYSSIVSKIGYDSGVVFFTDMKTNRLYMSNAPCIFEASELNAKKIVSNKTSKRV